MKTCFVCTPNSNKPQTGIEVDYCMVCGIFYVNFGANRPRLYEQLEHQTQRWKKQSRALRSQ